MLVPSTVLSDLIVVHAQFGFCFLETLLYSPTDSAQPDKYGESRAQWRVAYIEGILALITDSSPHGEPHGSGWKAIFAQSHTSSGELIFYRAFGALGYLASVPEKTMDALCQVNK